MKRSIIAMLGIVVMTLGACNNNSYPKKMKRKKPPKHQRELPCPVKDC
ncbi:hypothetical protein [Aureibacter tunicatorum]|uniref:Lipoprotein NlpE involved in copper resistance n=1 Tax=Aureibacter tunicatorum TaxID=866807 RepID=A0AAE3XPA5_9BACT|nr:hypothetical protein [Aureibacter tunicatorum]MDR6240213.1 putative lipoprotein NlpE involved in copper resistance [Aureibacter tunicatorum]BDD05906.1 hypothetical protein AUTU_33890 [Aureibacter tunicatorum]